MREFITGLVVSLVLGAVIVTSTVILEKRQTKMMQPCTNNTCEFPYERSNR